MAFSLFLSFFERLTNVTKSFLFLGENFFASSLHEEWKFPHLPAVRTSMTGQVNTWSLGTYTAVGMVEQRSQLQKQL